MTSAVKAQRPRTVSTINRYKKELADNNIAGDASLSALSRLPEKHASAPVKPTSATVRTAAVSHSNKRSSASDQGKPAAAKRPKPDRTAAIWGARRRKKCIGSKALAY